MNKDYKGQLVPQDRKASKGQLVPQDRKDHKGQLGEHLMLAEQRFFGAIKAHSVGLIADRDSGGNRIGRNINL